ncbi:MAG: DNA-3-methyladenine glycosylase 2 family protein [Chloroflexi bacterium]|nr:MAG: DNA-3-methyladenine glycosylase 2 family protein [Chloroflexota bacterium]
MDNAIAHLKSHDPILGDVIERYPVPSFQKHANYYQSLVESIIGQQLSVKAAAAIRERFVGLFDGPFPSPQQILSIDVETYRSVGLSRPKARYIIDLAERVIDGSVHFDHLDTLSNQEIIEELTAVKGIGVWTVHMFLMFCMGRLDVLPTGDLGIRNAVQKLYGFESTVTPEQVGLVADDHDWHPYESVASFYLWRSLENMPVTS